MTKFIWFAFVVVLSVALGSSEDTKPSKGMPVVPMIQLNKASPMQAILDDSDAPSADIAGAPVLADAALADSVNNVARLNPIPVMYPSFLTDNIFNKIPLLNQLINSNPVETEKEEAVSQDNISNVNNDEQPRRGILTILVVKSSKANEENAADAIASPSLFIKNSGQAEFRSEDQLQQPPVPFSGLTKFIISKIFGEKFGFEDGTDENGSKNNVVLLGGKTDPDSRRESSHEEISPDEEEQNKPILSFFKIRQNHFFIGRDDDDLNGSPSFFIKTGDSNEPKISDDIGFGNSLVNHQQHMNKKKCMMLSFMRLKASVYYRTIIHLLFISGVILFILLMSILTVRIYKRRRALRFYSQNMSVSTIDGECNKKKLLAASSSSSAPSTTTFLFRLGSLRNSYAQKSAEKLSSPPAYDQLISNETAIPTRIGKVKNSLLNSIKTRYNRLSNQNQAQLSVKADSVSDEDKRSVSSLPAYDEHVTKINYNEKSDQA